MKSVSVALLALCVASTALADGSIAIKGKYVVQNLPMVGVVPLGCTDPLNVEYLGAFRVPTSGYSEYSSCGSSHMVRDSTFYRGGAQICYSSDGGTTDSDGYPGTIYMVGWTYGGADTGHPECVHGGWWGRLDIPAPQINSDPNALPIATIVAPLANYHGSYFASAAMVGGEQRMGDMFWLKNAEIGWATGHLISSVWCKYRNQSYFGFPTLFTNSESANDLHGKWRIGQATDESNYSDPWFMFKHCNTIFEVPIAWAGLYAGGRYIAVGNGDRDGCHPIRVGCECGGGLLGSCYGQYEDPVRIGVHLGPGFALINPASISSADSLATHPDSSSVSAVEASGYYGGHYCEHAWTDSYELPNGPIDRMQDLTMFKEMAWISDKDFNSYVDTGHQSVICVLQRATHQCDYSNPTHCYAGDDACHSHLDCNLCGFVSGRPNDGLPLPNVKPEMWFFNPDDYRQVLQHQQPPWFPRAYAKLDLSQVYYNTRNGCPDTSTRHGYNLGQDLHIGGVAYDRANSLLYLSEDMAWFAQYDDGNYPVVHVFKIKQPS